MWRQPLFKDGNMASRCVLEMLGGLELRAAVFRYSFAFPKAGKELNSKEGLAYISQGKRGLGRGLAFPTG